MYECSCCQYKTGSKWSYNYHMQSKRHQELTRSTLDNTVSKHICDKCKKQYQSRNGLWKHKRSCTVITTPADNGPNVVTEELTNVIIAIHDELKEIRKTQALVVPTTNNQTNNITTNNQHVHVYLNTHCPNAMNMNQFINSISLNPSVNMNFQEAILRRKFEDFAKTVQ